ncbi:hypothetical protein N7G274_006586 [Stereocaulon virgatum]|uniref:Uncharacterized protein n=1 Tax=Stereocaulon virgatum TaxID=373712 RepID=A0ABR4A8A4_9LECA
MSQPAMEEEDEGTMTKFGIILRDPKKSSGTALTTFVTQTTAHYENDNEKDMIYG